MHPGPKVYTKQKTPVMGCTPKGALYATLQRPLSLPPPPPPLLSKGPFGLPWVWSTQASLCNYYDGCALYTLDEACTAHCIGGTVQKKGTDPEPRSMTSFWLVGGHGRAVRWRCSRFYMPGGYCARGMTECGRLLCHWGGCERLADGDREWLGMGSALTAYAQCGHQGATLCTSSHQ